MRIVLVELEGELHQFVHIEVCTFKLNICSGHTLYIHQTFSFHNNLCICICVKYTTKALKDVSDLESVNKMWAIEAV